HRIPHHGPHPTHGRGDRRRDRSHAGAAASEQFRCARHLGPDDAPRRARSRTRRPCGTAGHGGRRLRRMPRRRGPRCQSPESPPSGLGASASISHLEAASCDLSGAPSADAVDEDLPSRTRRDRRRWSGPESSSPQVCSQGRLSCDAEDALNREDGIMSRLSSLVRSYPLVVTTLLVAVAGLIRLATPAGHAAGWIVGGYAVVVAAWEAVGVVRQLLEGHAGLDIRAVTAITAAVLVGEPWAALVVVLMLTGGAALEDYAENRSKRELTALLRKAPQQATRILDESPADHAADAF